MRFRNCHCDDKTCLHNDDGVCSVSPRMEVETFPTYSRGTVNVVVCKSYKGEDEEDV